MDWPIVLSVGIAGFTLGILVGFRLRKKTLPPNDEAVENARQIERQRLNMVLDLISSMSSTLIYNRVLEMLLDLGARALSGGEKTPDPKLISAVLLFSTTTNSTVLRVGPARGLVQADLRTTLPGLRGLVAEVIENGDPILAGEVRKDPELYRIVSLHPCQSFYCLPLRLGLDAYGVVFFAYLEPEYFTAEKQEVLSILSHQALIALQNARLYDDLEQEKERMMEIQEEARKKLARDLHDGPTQSVAAIAMRINFTRRLVQKDIDAAAKELERIEDLARRTTKEIRHMLFTLRPLVLESQGLVAALQAMAEKMRDTFEQNVIVDVDASILPELEIGKQTVIFYIVEEAVNNARKHAQAAHIWVRLKRLPSDMALLEIKDDGLGFNTNAVNVNYENRGSLGMVNLRERSDLINGHLRIDSAEGKGATVQVAIPLTDEAADRMRQKA